MGDISKPSGLDWVKLQHDMDKSSGIILETTWEKVIRKSKENPFVPIGFTVTIGALGYGLYNFKKGRVQMQQNMMRLRVAAQFFTVLAAVGGVFIALPKEKRNIKDFIASGER